jgi:hypothetical protein
MQITAMIGLVNKDGSVCAVYLHTNGSPMYAGRILLKAFDKESLEKLLNLGDLLVLGNNVVPVDQNAHSGFSPEKDTCIFYGRDRRQSNTSSCLYASVDDLKQHRQECDYFYLMNSKKGEGKWYITDIRESEEMFDLERIIRNMH